MIEGGIYFEREFLGNVKLFLVIKKIDDVILGLDIMVPKENEISNLTITQYLQNYDIKTYIKIDGWYIDSNSSVCPNPNGYLGKIDKSLYNKMIPFFLDKFKWISQVQEYQKKGGKL